MHLYNMDHLRLRRYSVFVATCALLLLIAGGLVTSNDAALSIPDWPLAWGKLVPPLEGGIRYEFAHRVLAAAVALLTVGLAVWSRRRLAWLAVFAVAAQALLGGIAVRLVAPKALVVAHACLAQLWFGLLVAVVVHLWSASRDRREVAPRRWHPAAVAAATALFAQTILGAAVRHGAAGAAAHIAGAGVAVILVMSAALPVFLHHAENSSLLRAAFVLLGITFFQVFLGLAAFAVRAAAMHDPQPMPLTVAVTVSHVTAGSLAFAAAVVFAMVYRRAPVEADLAQGGMVVA